MDKEIHKEINERLNAIYEIMQDKVSNNNIIMTQVMRNIDYAFVFSKFHQKVENKIVYGVYLNIWPTILELIYSNDNTYPNFLSREDIMIYSNNIMGFYSKYIDLTRLLELYKTDLVQIEKIKDSEYKVTTNYKNGIERLESSDYYNFIEQDVNVKINNKERNKVYKIMRKLVFTFDKHLIGYGADEIVDNYFFKKAEEYSYDLFGKDEFPLSAKFGGVEFKNYVNAIKFLISIALKHITFCQLLIQKNPNVNLLNILTIYKTVDEITDDLTYYLKLEKEDVLKIINTIVITSEEIKTKKYDNTFPIFIEVTKDTYIRSIIGCLVEPYLFLLKRLENKYSKDWSREISKREEIFRKQLYNFFDNERYITIGRNIRLYKDKKEITDIDALIYDKDNNSIGIFQLKWQDPFGRLYIERSSKKTNFIKSCNKWIDDVLVWLDENDLNTKRNTLGLKKLFNEDTKIYTFIVGRYFSKFSDTLEIQSQKATWGNWYQINRILNDIKSKSNVLYELHKCLLEEFNENAIIIYESDVEVLELEGLIFHLY